MDKEKIMNRKIEWFHPDIYQGFSGVEERKQYTNANNQKDYAHVCQVAEDVCRHSFVFDMELDLERTYEPVVFEGEIDWEHNPGTDAEFVWQFNRHRFLIVLGQVYQMTKNEKYAEKAVELMLHFIEHQPYTEQRRWTTWRVLEIGMRSGNWMKALYLFQDSPAFTDDKLTIIFESLKLHAKLLIEEWTPYCYVGNWGVLENHGLFILGALMPCDEDTKSYLSHAADVLTKALKMQVMQDGMQLEQSPMYHFEVLRCMLEVAYISKKRQIEMDEVFYERIYEMSIAALKMTKPNGHMLSMGDSDDMNVQSIMQLAAILFQDGKLKVFSGEYLDHENVWFINSEDIQSYHELEVIYPEYQSLCLYDSGQYFFRSGWDKKADMLHFDGGLLGSSHGHSDALHVDLMMNGKDVLVDSGRYSYVYDDIRKYLKNPKGHNTIVVDGMDYSEWENSWVSKTVTAQVKQPMKCSKIYEYAQAGHMGYMTLDNPVFVNRKVLHIKPDIYLILDECYTSGEHTYTEYFHFDCEGTLQLDKNQALFQIEDTKATFFFEKMAKQEVIQTMQSKHYNMIRENQTISSTLKGKGFQSMLTVCVKGDGAETKVNDKEVRLYRSQEVQSKNLVRGLEISHKDKTYLIILAHTEMPGPVDSYQIDDRMGCGNVIVFDMDDGAFDGTVLNW